MNARVEDSRVTALHAELSALAGEAAVITSPEERAFYSADVYAPGTTAALVVRPSERETLPDLVSAVSRAGFAFVCRGGGMSYTGGYTPTRESTVLFDLAALNRILSIDEDDLVITVEAGVTWQQIHEAVQPFGVGAEVSARITEELFSELKAPHVTSTVSTQNAI